MGIAFLTLQVDAFYSYNINQNSSVFSGQAKERKGYHQLLQELKGKHLKIATVQNDVLSSTVNKNGTLVGKGIAFEIIDLMQEKFQFNYSIVLPKENKLGSENSGIFGLLNNNEVDLAAAFLPMTSIYWTYAQFGTALDFGNWVIVLKRSEILKVSGSGLQAPFSNNLWIVIFLLCVTMGLILYALNSIYYKKCKDNQNATLTDCVWFVYSAILKQGTRMMFTSDSSRLLLTTWWIFVIMITAFYTANLTAYLTISDFELPVEKPRDIQTKQLSWLAISGSAIEHAFDNRFVELTKVLRGTNHKFIEKVTIDDLRKWVYERKYLYIAENPNIDILLYKDYLLNLKINSTVTEKCKYALTTWPIFKCSRSFAYSKKFKFGLLFDKSLRHLIETGFVQRALNRRLPGFKICPVNIHNSDRKLKNSDLIQIYYILFTGSILAFIIFVFEKIINSFNCKNITTNARPRKSEIDSFNYVSISPWNSINNKSYKRKKMINGREYWVINVVEKQYTLIPVRAVSTMLFQIRKKN